MGQHQAIDVILPALGPLTIVLADDGWAVAQDVRYLLKTWLLLPGVGSPMCGETDDYERS